MCPPAKKSTVAFPINQLNQVQSVGPRFHLAFHKAPRLQKVKQAQKIRTLEPGASSPFEKWTHMRTSAAAANSTTPSRPRLRVYWPNHQTVSQSYLFMASINSAKAGSTISQKRPGSDSSFSLYSLSAWVRHKERKSCFWSMGSRLNLAENAALCMCRRRTRKKTPEGVYVSFSRSRPRLYFTASENEEKRLLLRAGFLMAP